MQSTFNPLHVILMVLSIKKVLSLSCYECSATNEKQCEISQVRKTCSLENYEDSCLTLSYEYTLATANQQKITKSVFRKVCTSKDACHLFCRTRMNLNYNNCRIHSCCQDDNCNEITNNQPIVSEQTRSPNAAATVETSFIIVLSFFVTLFYTIK